jgi:hypothetical protein
MREVRIYCPKCRYVPGPGDRWMCASSCGCIWNTFETCGVCPRCGKNWEDTQCPACQQWSPHADWYHESGPGEPAHATTETEVLEPAQR